jgi:outer membrane receptor protein involved in Fe transport
MFTKVLTSCFFLFSLICFSQEFKVNGIITEANGQPIAYANVLLIKKSNTSQVLGAISDEAGHFFVENVLPADYTLKVSFLGFDTYSNNITISASIDLGNIVLNENIQELDGVTVVAKRPTIKRQVDRLVFNVENSTLSNNNVVDVLKHSPGVIVHDGTITIKQAIPIIYINDRRVHLSQSEIYQLLEATSANNIKSIEVITTPPARYDAEGGSVINIVTSKNIIAGYRGSVFGDYKLGSVFPKYSFGTSHFFKAKKLNTYINYSISPRKDFRNQKEYVNFIENNQIVSTWNTDYNRVRESANQNINANLDYELNDKNTLSFSTNMLIAPREGVRNNVNSFTEVFGANKILDSTFNTINKSVYETFNFAFTLDYVHKLNREGEQLSFSGHHTNYDYSVFQNVETTYLFPDETLIRDNKFQTLSSQLVKLYTGQVDYELPIDDSSFFESGVKFSSIDSEGELTQYVFENGNKIEDTENSDTFLYDETNYALYTSYSKDWDTWKLKAGIRGEYTNLIGNSLSMSMVNKNKYLKLFPSFYVLHDLNETNQIYFSYNKRIYRPKFNELNPFKYFLNDNTVAFGNPNLKPEIDDVFILGYTFNTNYTFEVYYRYENDPNIEIAYLDNDNRLFNRIFTNIDHNVSYGLDFTTYTPITNYWNLYVLSSLFYNENNFYAFDNNSELLQNNNWNLYAQIINYFSFLEDKSLTADVSLSFITPYIEGPRTISNRTGVNINLRKSLWKNRASVSVGVLDVFNTQNFSTKIKYLDQDASMESTMENRLFTFGFNYKFGNFKLNDNKKEIESRERERLGNTSN